MTPALNILMKSAPVLMHFRWPGDDPIDMLHRMRRSWDTASSGEQCMIGAAFSFLPTGWLPKDLEKPPFELADCCCLDHLNTEALLWALAVEAENTGVLKCPVCGYH